MVFVPIGKLRVLQVHLDLIIHLRIHVFATSACYDADDAKGERSERDHPVAHGLALYLLDCRYQSLLDSVHIGALVSFAHSCNDSGAIARGKRWCSHNTQKLGHSGRRETSCYGGRRDEPNSVLRDRVAEDRGVNRGANFVTSLAGPLRYMSSRIDMTYSNRQQSGKLQRFLRLNQDPYGPRPSEKPRWKGR